MLASLAATGREEVLVSLGATAASHRRRRNAARNAWTGTPETPATAVPRARLAGADRGAPSNGWAMAHRMRGTTVGSGGRIT